MNNPNYNEIELYLRGAMSPEQRAAFESRLGADTTLREETLFYEAVLTQNDASFKQKMTPLGKELMAADAEQAPMEVTFKPVQRRLFMRYAAAASILLAATVGLWWAVGVGNNLSDFPDQTYQPYPVSGLLGDSGETARLQNRAIALYEARDYAEAIPLLDVLSADKSYGPQALIMKGCALYETGEYAKALKAFEAIPQTARSLRKNADYYMALTLIKSGDLDAATKALAHIAQDADSPWRNEAAAALKRRRR